MSLYGWDWDFSSSWYNGSTVTTEVPWEWPVSLDGYSFMVDWQHVDYLGLREGSYVAASTPLVRTQADTSDEPGEQTLNPESPWRRAAESWHAGSGQAWQDRKESDEFRFASSKGINPWTKYQLTLLNDTAHKLTLTSSNNYLAATATNIYVADGSNVRYSPTGATWTTITGPDQVTSICSDGTTVYAAYGTSGIYSGTTALTSYVTGTVNMVRFCNGRLLASSGSALYNIIGTPVIALSGLTALVVNVPSTWVWSDACSGGTFIYACGYSGNTSAVYSIGLKSDASSLAAPQVAGSLLPGEICYSVTQYGGGYIKLGLNTGWRFAQCDPTTGALTIGDLIPTSSPVLCGAQWDRFLYYGLTNYDGTSTGLGRADPLTFTDNITPAYATDLMATAQGTVRDVCFFLGQAWFTVDDSGVWTDSGTPVTSGTISSGRITYDLPDPKNALFVDLLHQPLGVGDEIDALFSVEDGPQIPLGASIGLGSTSSGDLDAEQRNGRWFTHTVVLKGDPTLNRVTLQAWPTPHRVNTITVPLMFSETITVNDADRDFDCVLGEQKINDLLQSGLYVNFQYGSQTTRVFVFDTSFTRTKMTTDHRGHQGTMSVTLREL